MALGLVLPLHEHRVSVVPARSVDCLRPDPRLLPPQLPGLSLGSDSGRLLPTLRSGTAHPALAEDGLFSAVGAWGGRLPVGHAVSSEVGGSVVNF